jgi:hypothetical protein
VFGSTPGFSMYQGGVLVWSFLFWASGWNLGGCLNLKICDRLKGNCVLIKRTKEGSSFASAHHFLSKTNCSRCQL